MNRPNYIKKSHRIKIAHTNATGLVEKKDADRYRTKERYRLTKNRASIERKGIAHSLMEARERFANRKDR